MSSFGLADYPKPMSQNNTLLPSKRQQEDNQTWCTKFIPTAKNTVLYHVAGKEPRENVEGYLLKAETQLHFFSLNNVTKSEELLYRDAHSVFTRAQQISEINDITSDFQSFHRASLKTALHQVGSDYASIIEEYVNELGKLEQIDPLLHCDEFETATKIFGLWELCRILYMSQRARFSLDLVYWVNKFFPPDELTPEQEQQLRESPQPHKEPDFQKFLKQMVLRGDVRAKELFSCCLTGDEMSADDQAIKSVVLHISNRPQIQDEEGLEFNVEWINWHAENNSLTSQLNLSDPELQELLHEVLGILAGDFETIVRNCDHWAGALGGLLFHQEPKLVPSDLKGLLDACLHEKPPAEGEFLGQIMLDFLNWEIKEGLERCAKVDLWLVAHLSDLLSKLWKIEPIPDQSTTSKKLTADWLSDFREFRLLEYAEVLAGHHTLWSLAFDYFRYCPSYGQTYIQELITKVPLDTESKIQKVLNICKVNGLREETRIICRITAMKYLRERRPTPSLVYFAKANDTIQMRLIVHAFLEEIISTGESKFLNVLDSLPASEEMIDDSLNFLSQYGEFHHMLKDQNYENAKGLLIGMIKSQVSPRQFWPVLLLNTLPLLQRGGKSNSSAPVFSKEDIFDILCILEEVTSTCYRQEFENSMNRIMQWYTVDKGYEEIDAKLLVVRLALAKDSAKAFTSIVQDTRK